ncbi:uncharacterized protein GLRG_09403 [Colletotrichum graminicola M1.001]|uniref:Uncharacterized protein n=1 Tax=Colletotrichum graminicola (strain M1.001 / M2 / FGSC 10212) TaxID=645133 RepID=E3QTU7_COLGM|nr:uncharacterized protein GLRG_09403 [Colletotrichum graminicola M1.001]EFQ34259.1 hypothetical protein GLRG_09403 [Colletotrichum graminicola M1.001]
MAGGASAERPVAPGSDTFQLRVWRGGGGRRGWEASRGGRWMGVTSWDGFVDS